MNKKIFTLFVLLLLLPVTALAAEEIKLFIGGQQITESGCYANQNGTWTKVEGTGPSSGQFYYDASTFTLTLNQAEITHDQTVKVAEGYTYEGSVIAFSQTADVSLKIVVSQGTSTITGTGGIRVESTTGNASLSIKGSGSLDVEPKGSNSGITLCSSKNTNLDIDGADVTASSPAQYGVYLISSTDATSTSTITVNNGSLTTGGNGNVGIYYYWSGTSNAGTSSLTVSGNAVVDTRNSQIMAQNKETVVQVGAGSDGNGGIVFNGKNGTVYGDVTLQEDLEIGEGESLTIPEDASLTVPEGTTLTNNGRIINYGTIDGTVTGTVATPLTVEMITVADATYTGVAVTPDVTVVKDGVAYTKDTDYTVSYSDNTNAGRATVTVTPKTDGDSRLVGGAVDIEFTIAKATPTITLTVPTEDDLVYDGADKKATAIVKGVENETEELTATITYYSDETCQTKVDETKNAGTYYVKASFAETKNYMAMEETASFTITQAPATLSFTKETVSATIGETVENTLTVTPAGVTVSYSSSDEKVATVDASTGAITLVGTGETIITATISDPNYTGYPASYTLTVSKATLAGNEITAEGATNISIEKNGTPFKLTAIVTKDDLGIGGKWEWTSDNETVATVAAEQGTLRAATSTSSATVTPLSVGTATITATYEDNKYVGSVTYTVTVTKPYVPDPISYYNIYVEDVCDGVEVSTSKQVVREGGSITVYVEKDTANYTFDNFKVYYKEGYYDSWDELKEGTQPGEYPIKNIWTHIYIKAEGAEEKEDPTGIESIEGVKVYTKDGSLYVQTPQREQVIIVSMSGAVVKNEEQIGLKQYHGLQPGIYIVRVGDRAYKVRLN